MTNRPLIVCDLGFGDAGKGSIVDFLVRQFGLSLVVRFNGGAQAAHNVIDERGRHHTFSSFGSGALTPGVKTLLSKYVLVDPLALENEESALREVGVEGAFENMFADERALVVTPFHIILNRARESGRGDGKHGSCGMGIGETVLDSLNRPDAALRVKDLASPGSSLTVRVQEVRAALAPAFETLGLQPPGLDVDRLAAHYARIAAQIHIVGPAQADELLRSEKLIFEGAQGILLDQSYGFHPYTTWSNATSHNAVQILAEAGISATPLTIGVTRTYSTRHGPGPFPTEDEELTAAWPDMHNGIHPWQGKFRVGWLDLPLLTYAVRATRGIDCVALTHLDKLSALALWQVCHSHGTAVDEALTNLPATREEQEQLGRRLAGSAPGLERVDGAALAELISEHLRAPVGLRSVGPTCNDKELTPGPLLELLM